MTDLNRNFGIQSTLHNFTMQDNHRKFADKYFETLNGYESAIYAGFAENSARQQAWQLLQREDVQEYLQGLRSEYAEKSGITKAWVLERFKDISDRCVQAEPVYDNRGIPTGEYKFDSSGANKATEMLGKIIGVFEKDNNQKPAATNIINLGGGVKPDEAST